jgi:hypothetical protein
MKSAPKGEADLKANRRDSPSLTLSGRTLASTDLERGAPDSDLPQGRERFYNPSDTKESSK